MHFDHTVASVCGHAFVLERLIKTGLMCRECIYRLIFLFIRFYSLLHLFRLLLTCIVLGWISCNSLLHSLSSTLSLPLSLYLTLSLSLSLFLAPFHSLMTIPQSMRNLKMTFSGWVFHSILLTWPLFSLNALTPCELSHPYCTRCWQTQWQLPKTCW